MKKHKIKIKDVVGPFPSTNKCFVIGESDSKLVALSCSVSDANICFKAVRYPSGRETNPYNYTSTILSSLNIDVSSQIILSGIEPYSVIYLTPDNGKIMKLSFDNSGPAINTSIFNKIPLEIKKSDLDKLRDCSSTYWNLKRNLCVYPLPEVISETYSLQILSEFIDEVCQVE